jgi:hypothetical protein
MMQSFLGKRQSEEVPIQPFLAMPGLGFSEELKQPSDA